MARLFNKKTISGYVTAAQAVEAEKQAILREWANTIASGEIKQINETQLESKFLQKIVVDVLGYSNFNDSGEWTVQPKQQIGGGEVDLALGHFAKNVRTTIAPFELKGAKTTDLDAILPGRAKSTIDQAWEYANDNVGTKWVLASNMLEIRLYSYAEGRSFSESFDLATLHEDQALKRFMLLLSAENLLSGRTADLLEESKREDKDISEQLYADYKALRHNLIGAVRVAAPDMEQLHAIGVAQTILDRVLFIAFAEDNNLIPKNTIESAYRDSSKFNPQPIWQNFLGLFRAIDKGDDALAIPRYNGGLFNRDEVIRSLEIPDLICEGFKNLASYDFASEVPVTVLGRIFEQSISDIENLQRKALGEEVEEKKSKGTSGRKKRDGVVYTPDYIARFIVEQTIGAHLAEIFASILTEYAKKGAKADDDPIRWKSAKAEREAWASYRDRIAKLRIVDPACGSGVFLVMAFDFLKAELARVNDKLAELEGKGQAGSLFDPDSEILTNNLFGVDVNKESVEIAKLSLWIKTARRGKVLDSLDKNFWVGDSLIEDSSYAYREHGFVWKDAFPGIFAQGGFDIVLGNPPYVRQELLKELKPYLKTRFEVFSGVVDLYAYFFERGLKILKPGGRLGFISSSTFFKIKSGSRLRDFIQREAMIETVVDFGDIQVFEGVTTYPAILTMKVGNPEQDHTFRFWNIIDLPKENFTAAYEDHAELHPQAALENSVWKLESIALRALRHKIVGNHPSLKSRYGKIFRGITTGRNEAFVIDGSVRRRLISEHSNSSDLIVPWLGGDSLERWHQRGGDDWLILSRQGTHIESYPAIRAYLHEKYETLVPKPEGWVPPKPEEKWPGRKSGSYKWFELQDKTAYWRRFQDNKIISTKVSKRPTFSFDKKGYFLGNTSYIIDAAPDNLFILAILNSNLADFFFKGVFTVKRGGFYEVQPAGLEAFPLPEANDSDKIALAALAEAAQTAVESRYEYQQVITRRIPDLATDVASIKLSTKLKEWWALPDFAAFRKEVKKALKADIPLTERNEWENWINKTRAEITDLTADISRIEGEINAKVYTLFDLTPDEIKLLEANI